MRGISRSPEGAAVELIVSLWVMAVQPAAGDALHAVGELRHRQRRRVGDYQSHLIGAHHPVYQGRAKFLADAVGRRQDSVTGFRRQGVTLNDSGKHQFNEEAKSITA